MKPGIFVAAVVSSDFVWSDFPDWCRAQAETRRTSQKDQGPARVSEVFHTGIGQDVR